MITPIFILFILGLCVGSFLNVVIDRLPFGKPIFLSRSFCDHCQHTLAWYDLIPVFSFLFLKAKCRYCHKKISGQYPIVEFITGFLFIFTYLSLYIYHLSFIIYHLILISSLIAIFFTDLKYRIIPDKILLFLLAISFIYRIIFEKVLFFNHLASAIILFAVFLLLVIITHGKGMGLGDVKFAAVAGFILGFPKMVIFFYLSFLTGALVSVILIITGKKTMKSTIPFGPFLTASTVVSLYYGDILWNLFRKIIGI